MESQLLKDYPQSLSKLTMEPIPEKFQVRTNRAVLDSSQNLHHFSLNLRDTIKRMNYEEGSGKITSMKNPSHHLHSQNSIMMAPGKNSSLHLTTHSPVKKRSTIALKGHLRTQS